MASHFLSGGTTLLLLDNLRVPFLCFREDADLSRTSAAARALLASVRNADSAIARIRGLAMASLEGPLSGIEAGGFAFVREVPIHEIGGVITIHRPIRPTQDVAVVALLHSGGIRSHSAPLQRRLTGREFEVASLIAAGATNKEVAARFRLSAHTVRHHLERVYRKLGVTNRASLARLFASEVAA